MPPRRERIGYQKLADYIASDHSLSIYRRFAALNARNILYLQCELADIEDQLIKLDSQAKYVEPFDFDTARIPRSWKYMRLAGIRSESEKQDAEKAATSDSGARKNVDYGEMWRVVHQMRSLLEAYNTALRDQAWLHSLKKPSTLSQKALRHTIDVESLISKEDAQYIYDDEKADDLACLAPESGQEILSQFLENKFYRFFQSKSDKERSTADSPLQFFSESRIHFTVRALAVIFSSILPILSVVVLYFIQSNKIRLGLIVLFTILCSSTLAFLSRASNSEIIVATATYAAVQVVFVSSNINTTP